MPSIASHFVCANIVSTKLGINSDDFFIGNVLPDIIDKENSHYKRKGQYYLVPDINEFLKHNKPNSDVGIGYLCHLLLDKHFLEEYVPQNIRDFDKDNVFTADKIYKDYTTMNPLLLRLFNLDLQYLNLIMKKSGYKLNADKHRRNIESINSLSSENQLEHIELDIFVDFLRRTSEIITQELREIIENREKEDRSER